jgi:predicted enzyme related to lactoylglutathione lyase
MEGCVDQFGNSSATWAINFRVPDLDGMVEQLRAAGTEVTVDPTTYSMGRFASLTDPEGNPIQLWEPAD